MASDADVNIKLTCNVEELRTDAQFAEQLRIEMKAALAPVCAVMDKAHARGLQINFNVGNDPLGKTAIQNLSVIKVL